MLSLDQPRMERPRNGSCCPWTRGHVPPRVLYVAGAVPLKGGRAWRSHLGGPRKSKGNTALLGGTLSFTLGVDGLRDPQWY